MADLDDNASCDDESIPRRVSPSSSTAGALLGAGPSPPGRRGGIGMYMDEERTAVDDWLGTTLLITQGLRPVCVAGSQSTRGTREQMPGYSLGLLGADEGVWAWNGDQASSMRHGW